MATAVTTFFILIGVIFVSAVLIFIPILFGMGIEQDREEEKSLVFLATFVLIEWFGLSILLSVLIL